MIGKYSHLMPQLVIVGESQADAVRHRQPFLTATTTAMITRVAMLRGRSINRVGLESSIRVSLLNESQRSTATTVAGADGGLGIWAPCRRR